MKKHASAVARLSVSSVVATLTQIAKSKLGAVLLGTTGMGTLNQLKNVWNLVQLLANAGFYDGLVRRIAQLRSEDRHDQVRLQVATTCMVLGVVSVVIAAVSAAASPLISSLTFDGDRRFAPYIAVILISVPFAVFARVYKGILAGMREVPLIVKSQISADILSVVIFGALVWKGQLWGAVIAFAIYHVMKAGWGYYYVCSVVDRSSLLPGLKDFSREELRHNLKFGVNTFVLTPASMLTTLLVASWIIGAEGRSANGVFSAAWLVSSVYLRTIYETASSYYLPVLSASRDDESLFENMSGALRLYMLALTPCVLGLITMGPLIIALLFSRDFTAAGTLLIFLLPGDLMRVNSETIGLAYLAKQQLRVYAASYFVWVALYLGLSHLMIARCGMTGAAMAYLTGQLIYVVFHVTLARFVLGFQPEPGTRRIILASILICAVAGLIVLWNNSVLSRCTTLAGGTAAWWLMARRDTELRDLARRIKDRYLPGKSEAEHTDDMMEDDSAEDPGQMK